MPGSGCEADAKGEGIHDCISGFLGAGSVLAGDNLARPDGEAIPVTQAAHIDAAHLQQELSYSWLSCADASCMCIKASIGTDAICRQPAAIASARCATAPAGGLSDHVMQVLQTCNVMPCELIDLPQISRLFLAACD